MNPSLFTLIRLQYRGFMRRMTRGAESPRRAIFLVVGLVMILAWVGPGLITAVAVRHGHPEKLQASEHRFRIAAPVALLAICLLTIISSAGDKAIAFSPGEVDMLFPGPFTRRELLGYKLTKSALAAFLSALVMSLALMPYSTSWAACYVGVFFTLLFIQLFSTAGVLLGQALGQHAQTMFRRVVLFGAIGLVLLIARNYLASRGGMRALYEFRDSHLGRSILAPFEPFGRAITARDSTELARSAGAAALIDLGLLAVVILLDANYVEAALAASRRRYAQIQRIRGGSLLGSIAKGNVTWRLPQPPWFRGAGPVAWRQATSAARSAKGLLLVLLVVAIAIGPLFASALHTANIAHELIAVIAWLTVLLSGLLKFDFRGDLDYIEQLKALPLAPRRLAVGQVIVPTVILTAAHVLLLGGVAAATRPHNSMLLVAACLALPFNALLITIENVIFLLFPTRPAAASPGDFQVIGRQAIQLVIKGFAVLIGLGMALGIAAPIFVLMGGSLLAPTIIAWTVLGVEAVALIPVIAWAFGRFDPSIDTPV
jgi:hypothetical protein